MNNLIASFLAQEVANTIWLAPENEPECQKTAIRCWHDWDNLPADAFNLDGALWSDTEQHKGDRREICRQLAARLVPGGQLYLTTRIIPASRLRGKKGRLIKEAADYLNAFHRFLAPGSSEAVSQYTWQKWLTAAGFTIEKLEVEDKLTHLRLHPTHSHKDFVRLKVLLIHAPEVAKQRLTPYVADDRIQFHVYQANFVCRLKNYE